jgi:ankyrin repeat protein
MRLAALLLAMALAACSRFEVSPLAGAARAGNLKAIRSAVEAGADLDGSSGINGWTPLLHAIHKNQPGSVRELLDHGADVNRADPDGTTPLMMAAGYGQAGIVSLLLERGADPRRRDTRGRTALDVAKSGVADIDRWTLGRPDWETVELLSRGR